MRDIVRQTCKSRLLRALSCLSLYGDESESRSYSLVCERTRTCTRLLIKLNSELQKTRIYNIASVKIKSLNFTLAFKLSCSVICLKKILFESTLNDAVSPQRVRPTGFSKVFTKTATKCYRRTIFKLPKNPFLLSDYTFYISSCASYIFPL